MPARSPVIVVGHVSCRVIIVGQLFYSATGKKRDEKEIGQLSCGATRKVREMKERCVCEGEREGGERERERWWSTLMNVLTRGNTSLVFQ